MWHFSRLFGFGVVMAALLLAAGTDDVLAQKKKQADSSVAATGADYAMIQKNKEVTGKIVSASGGGKSLIFRVDTPTMEPNPKFKAPNVTNPNAKGYNAQANQGYQQIRAYQNIQREMQQVANARTPQQKQQAMRKLQMDMARLQMQSQKQYFQQNKVAGKGNNNPNNANAPFILVHHMKDYEFELQEGAVLRKMYLPTEFDDTGNIKEYTEKVKAELRGTDKSKPGYTAKLEELISGVEAKLYLVPKTTKKAAKGPDDDDGVGNIDPPFVKMVILTKESAAPASSPAAPPKKKAKK